MKHKRSAIFLLGLVAVGCLAFIGAAVFLSGNEALTSGKAEVRREASDYQDGEEHIHGQVIYQSRIALPPQALLLVQLVEVSAPEQAQTVVSELRLELGEQMPVPFILPLKAQDLPAGQSYALRARISVGDSLWFANDKPLMLERDKSAYLVRLEMVEQNADTTIAQTDIKNRQWLAEEIDGSAALNETLVSLMIDDAVPGSGNSAAANSAEPVRYQVTGSGGCNRYFSTAVLNEKKTEVQFEPIGMTFMLCDEALSHQESRFVDMMSKVRRYRLDETGPLYLMDANNRTIARFVTRN